MTRPAGASRIAIVMKGYPRLSETFIAQEILGLERRGLALDIWSLRRPTDGRTHPMHDAIVAPVSYLPEYLHRAPVRVLRGFGAALRRQHLGRALRAAWRDLRRDPSLSRLRRIGQAAVLARELPASVAHLHVHYLHTPASVVRYAALLTGLPWTFSAHAKDIWTTPGWEKCEKLADARWGVTCTAEAARHLGELAPKPDHVELVYHGLDLARFPPPPHMRPARDGLDAADPVRILSVGRAVEKKGYDDLLKALAALPGDLHWRFVHVGGGELLGRLKRDAAGLGDKVAFLGPKTQPEIVALMGEADLFVLPSRPAANGDQDGLPNVLMEAASQRLASVATRFAGIPEFLRDGVDGVLVPPGDWEALSNAINLILREPARREALGTSAYARLTTRFGAAAGLDRLALRFRETLSADGP